jgi:hypothetical protein
MLVGRFEDQSGAPYIEARLSFPRLGLRGFIWLLVDTGADGTVLMPTDGRNLDIDFAALHTETASQGIGGSATVFSEEAILSFFDARHAYSYLLTIGIAAPTAYNHRFPSLLGRDVLARWRCIIDPDRHHLTFTPRKWELRQRRRASERRAAS